MTAPVLRPLQTGEVLDVSFGLYRARFPALVVITAACHAIPIALSTWMMATGGPFAHWRLSMAQLLISLILNAIGVAATTFVVAGAYLGDDVAPMLALRSASPFIARLAVLSVLNAVALSLGLLFLIIPGLILLSGLVLSTPTLVLENLSSPIAAMDRSWELSRGLRMKILVACFVAVLLFMVPLLVVNLVVSIGSFFGTSSPWIARLITSVLGVFVSPFSYIVVIVLYYDARVRKEGLDVDLLAAATRPA